MLPGDSKTARMLRAIAFRLPDVEEGIACKGTKLEAASFGVGKKSFLFVGLEGDTYTVRLKLARSLADAAALAKRQPARLQVGAGGWVKMTFAERDDKKLLPLEPWIGESYHCVVGSARKGPSRAPAKPKRR